MKLPAKNKILGALALYLMVWGFLVSVDYSIDWFSEQAEARQIAELAELPASEWIEYIAITSEQPGFDEDEVISMRSFILRKRSAQIFWNDILYCDRLDSGEYSYIASYTSSRFYRVEKPDADVQDKAWSFGDITLQRPVEPIVSCYILSQQEVCPDETYGGQISCKHQEVISEEFYLKTGNTELP